MAFSTGSSTAAEINVTPLVDVLLVLLIIFMVIAPQLPRGLDSSLPQPSKLAAVTQAPVTVHVSGGMGGPRYRMGEQEVPFGKLRPELQRIFAGRVPGSEGRSVFVEADRSLSYHDVAAVAGEARAAGAGPVVFLTKSDAKR